MDRKESRKKLVEPFSQEWFKKRAIDGLHKTQEGWWDYSDSLLLYAGDAGVEDYEEIQQGESRYAKLVTQPERRFLEDIADVIAAELLDDFDYIDLGPGTEHKEQFLFNALQKEGKAFRYVPVDVSTYYLHLAQEYAGEQGIETVGVRASFEELAEKLPPSDRPRFVSMGLTFSNYEPQQVIKMLRCIAAENGKVFINAHMRDRTDMKELQSTYQNDVDGVINTKITYLGLNPDTDISNMEADDGIRFWCTVDNPTEAMRAKGFQTGDRMLVFQSLRYTREKFEEELQKSGSTYTIIDTDGPFVGAVIEGS